MGAESYRGVADTHLLGRRRMRSNISGGTIALSEGAATISEGAEGSSEREGSPCPLDPPMVTATLSEQHHDLRFHVEFQCHEEKTSH